MGKSLLEYSTYASIVHIDIAKTIDFQYIVQPY